MARRKSTSRRSWTPRAVFGAFDAYDDLFGGSDIDDELSELDELLGDPLDQVVMALARPPRPIRARQADLGGQPLTKAWCARVGDCNASAARLQGGIDYLLSGAVQDLQVGPRRLVATVLGTSRYRVEVEILLPPQADMQAALERVQQARIAPTGTDPRIATQRAIQGGGPGLFPSAAQLHGECTCTDGPRCKHIVAAVYAFGVLLDREPEQLFSLWGIDAKELQAAATFVIPPLATDRRRLVDDLAIFGIDLVDSRGQAAIADGTTIAVPSTESPTEPLPTTEPAPPASTPPVPAGAPPNLQSEVRREYLRVIGISPRTIDAWLRSGVLRKTDRDDTYERTPEASRKIAEFLER
ncbi:SWIM zinc finger family protein [Nannocystis sp.]|uniref:SWIM zinc finger family protein n=1 Tax=Nannocystis sp. TaxID=1962667 RepID=UPI00242762AB|nr:SWIM zinc finger family protein [Nannocystis sp.]MBK7827407.1 SWIM zinc finger family protein [Nannocystis sp.]MBK9756292.1 SWIM zinc finger family protein [Nannocystis sp.]